MRTAALVVSGIVICSGCDCGPSARNPGHIAVGATGKVFFNDACTDATDTLRDQYNLPGCLDESPGEVLAARVDSDAFEVAETAPGIVTIGALDVGDGTLTARFLLASGEERDLTASLQAREIDEIIVDVPCEVASSVPLIVPTLTPLTMSLSAAADSRPLATAGLPMLVTTESLVVEAWTGSDVAGSAGRAVLRGDSAGSRELTSPHDAAFKIVLDFVDRGSVVVTWRDRSNIPFRVNSGLPAMLLPDFASQGRPMCVSPVTTWTATVQTVGSCQVMARSSSGSSTGEIGDTATISGREFEGFHVAARLPGRCTIEIIDEGGFWPTLVELVASE